MCNKSQTPDKLCTQRATPSIGWGCWGSTLKTSDTLARTYQVSVIPLGFNSENL